MDNDEIKMVECEYCGEMVPEEDAIEYDGHIFCPDCMMECDECGEQFPCFKMTEVGDDSGEYVCEGCLEDHYILCDCCNNWVRNNVVAVNDFGHVICDNCFDDGWRMCDECGCLIDTDREGFLDEANGYWYCDDCAPSEEYDEDEVFMDYSSNPYFHFYGGNGVDGKLYYGVELEVDNGHDAVECAEEIMDANHEIYCKRDGSLSSCGFEIITHPCTLDYHLNNLDWADIRQKCRDYDFLSDQARSSCGLHIHIGLDGLKKDSDAKLVALVDHIWDDFCKITRRSDSSWAKRPSIERIDADDAEAVMLEKAKKAKNCDRYQAVNLETGMHHKHTVEIRAYKGTLNVSTIKACLIFTDCMARYVNTHSTKQCAVATIYDVAAMTDNPILRAYMERRGLTDFANTAA